MFRKIPIGASIIAAGALALYWIHKALASAFPKSATPIHGAGDWATWVGAIGTIGTLLGTIWIATRSSRLDQQAKHDMAVLAAAAIQVRLSESFDNLGVVALELARPIEDDGKMQPYINWAYRISMATNWTLSELAPLVHAAGHPAPKLAVARELLISCESALKSCPFNEESSLHETGCFNTRQSEIIKDACDMIYEAKIACDRLLAHDRRSRSE